jgi:hypothetical protein
MSAKVKLAGKLPGEVEINGLDAMAKELFEVPEKLRCGFVWYRTRDKNEKVATGEHIPTVEITRFEPVGDADKIPVEIRDAVLKLAEDRLHKQPLPFEFGEDPEESVKGAAVQSGPVD